MVDERRRMYEEQKAREEAELAAAAAEDARRKAILEEERRALLAEAADLLEYLPRGVLRDQVSYSSFCLAARGLGSGLCGGEGKVDLLETA